MQAAEPGGAELAVLRVAPRLGERGIQLHLSVPAWGGVAEVAEAAGRPVYELPVGGLERGAFARAAVTLPRAWRLGHTLRPDLVWFNGTVAQRLAPAFGQSSLVPHVHDLLEAAPRPWRMRGFWRRTPVVLCDSQAVADRAARLGAPAERLRVVYCPVEPTAAAEAPEWASGEGAIVGYVGRIEPRKGLLDLLQAAPAVLERAPRTRFVVVGEDEYGASPEYAGRVRDAAAVLGERVYLVGRVENANGLMGFFDVLAVPSHAEPFGTVAAEALAAGTPVVVTASGGMTEYVEDGKNGAVVPPGQPGALAEGLLRVLPQAEEMSPAARAAADRFSVEKVADAVADALFEAVAR